MRTRTIPGPRGPFLIPAEPEATSLHAERCCRSVFEGEYSYPRASPEDVRTALDIGANVGAWSLWAWTWWPSLEHIWAYEPNARAADLYAENLPGHWELEKRAVTSRAGDLIGYTCPDNWGAAHIVNLDEPRNMAIVPTFHPRDLPAADVLKIDVEGNGGEIAFNYPHWSGVRVCMYESHNAEERATLQSACSYAGLRMVRGNPLAPDCDVRVWVR